MAYTNDPFVTFTQLHATFNEQLDEFGFRVLALKNLRESTLITPLLRSTNMLAITKLMVVTYCDLFASIFAAHIGYPELVTSNDANVLETFSTLIDSQPKTMKDLVRAIVRMATYRFDDTTRPYRFLLDMRAVETPTDAEMNACRKRILEANAYRRVQRVDLVSSRSRDYTGMTPDVTQYAIPRFMLCHTTTEASLPRSRPDAPYRTNPALRSLMKARADIALPTHDYEFEQLEDLISSGVTESIEQSSLDCSATFSDPRVPYPVHSVALVTRDLLCSMERIVTYAAIAAAQLYDSDRDNDVFNKLKSKVFDRWVDAIQEFESIIADTEERAEFACSESSILMNVTQPLSEWNQRIMCHTAVVQAIDDQLAYDTNVIDQNTTVSHVESLVYSLAVASVDYTAALSIIEWCEDVWNVEETDELTIEIFARFKERIDDYILPPDVQRPFVANRGGESFSERLKNADGSMHQKLACFLHLLYERYTEESPDARFPSNRRYAADLGIVRFNRIIAALAGRRILRNFGPPLNTQSIFTNVFDLYIDGNHSLEKRDWKTAYSSTTLCRIHDVLTNTPPVSLLIDTVTAEAISESAERLAFARLNEDFTHQLNIDAVAWNSSTERFTLDRRGEAVIKIKLESSFVTATEPIYMSAEVGGATLLLGGGREARLGIQPGCVHMSLFRISVTERDEQLSRASSSNLASVEITMQRGTRTVRTSLYFHHPFGLVVDFSPL